MAKFHSNVSRRDFMKGLGLAGAGIGAAALTAPVFHDLDEMMSSSMADVKKPWWIKYRAFENPTIEVDWTLVKRYNSAYSAQSNNALYDKNFAQVTANVATTSKQWQLDKQPGFQLRDYAFNNSTGNPPGATNPWVPATSSYKTPESQGLPKYTGTPEENSRMLRTALRAFGAFGMAYVPLTDNTKKLVYSNGYNFEDVTLGYTNAAGVNIIPNNGITAIPLMAPEMLSAYHVAPSPIVRGIHSKGNQILGVVYSSGQRFLANLGYQGLSGGYGPVPPFMLMGGESEQGRIGGQAISPTYGMTQTQNILSTDMPLDPTPPIDAGIWKFCQHCGNCADCCPSDSITHDKAPSWDPPALVNSFSTAGAAFSIPGKKAYWNNMSTCKSHCDLCGGGCNICMGNCVFSHLEKANIHMIVKATLGTTDVFDPFFKKMDRIMGYGLQQFGSGNSPPLNGTFNQNAESFWTIETPPFMWDGRAENSHAQ